MVKTFKNIVLLVIVAAMLCGCPYSSIHAIDENPTIYVEDNLLGKWATFVKKPNSDKEEPVKVILSKKNETEYFISFTGYIDELKKFRVVKNDSITGTAFMSTIGKNQFLNININNNFYVAQFLVNGETISILPLIEHFTAKLIQNSQALRTAIDYHYRMRKIPLLDEDFCLRDMVRVN